MSDFDAYDRVFVLNPVEGSMIVPRTSRGKAKDAYRVTRSNVRVPADAAPLVQSEHLAFYQLTRPPQTWQFDREGNWIGTNAS